MHWLRRATALLARGEPELEEAPCEAGREPDPSLPALPAAGAAVVAPEVEAAVGTAVPDAATLEELRRVPDVGQAARVRLLGASMLPRASVVSRCGMKTVFVVCRGLLAAGWLQAVYCGIWDEVRHTVCTAAGNIDWGADRRGGRRLLARCRG